MTRECGACRFLSHKTIDANGSIGPYYVCRRYPPSASGRDGASASLPTVSPTDWCGEFEWNHAGKGCRNFIIATAAAAVVGSIALCGASSSLLF